MTVHDAKEAIAFYAKAFGATELFRLTEPSGKVGHAEIRIGNSRFMVNDVMPHQKGPKALGGSPASFWLYVDNADALFNRAVEAGATVLWVDLAPPPETLLRDASVRGTVVFWSRWASCPRAG